MVVRAATAWLRIWFVDNEIVGGIRLGSNCLMMIEAPGKSGPRSSRTHRPARYKVRPD